MIRQLLCLVALMSVTTAYEVIAAEKTPTQQALLQKAIKACNGPQYPSGARPVVNYSAMTFKCVEPGSTRR